MCMHIVHILFVCLQIYPRWWGDSEATEQQVNQSNCHQSCAAPRLAYSMQGKAEASAPLHKNDLITAAYLDVPSSGYGARGSDPAAKRALTWETGSTQASGKENKTGMKLSSIRVQQACQYAQLLVLACFPPHSTCRATVILSAHVCMAIPAAKAAWFGGHCWSLSQMLVTARSWVCNIAMLWLGICMLMGCAAYAKCLTCHQRKLPETAQEHHLRAIAYIMAPS